MSKVGLAQGDGRFVVGVHITGAAASDDELLTKVFVDLWPRIQDARALKAAVNDVKPSWQAVKGGDFVADEGSF